MIICANTFSRRFFCSLKQKATWTGNFISCPVYTVCFKVGHVDVVMFDLSTYGFVAKFHLYFTFFISGPSSDSTACTCLMTLCARFLMYRG